MDTNVIIYCTVPNADVARQLAALLVEKKAAACVNIIPSLVSVYSWKDEICTDNELLLLIKTKNELFDQVSSLVKSVHPYEIPELVAVPIIKGSSDYLQWIEQTVTR